MVGIGDPGGVGRMSRLMPVALLGLMLVACAAPAATPDVEGTLAIVAAYEEPPAGQPISIGGYGFFVSVDGGPEIEIPFDGSLQLPVATGAHELTFVTRPASDMVVVNADGESEREFYDISAECEQEVDVPSGGEVRLVYHAAGGEDCSVTIEEA